MKENDEVIVVQKKVLVFLRDFFKCIEMTSMPKIKLFGVEHDFEI